MKKKQRIKNTQLNIRIEDTLIEQIKAVTHESTGTGMSQFIRQAITDKLKKDNEKTL